MSGTLGSLVRYTSHSLRSKFFSSRYTSFVSLTTQATSQEVDKMATPQEMSSSKMFGGFNKRYKHDSSSVGCPMTFSIYFPPAADSDKVPVRSHIFFIDISYICMPTVVDKLASSINKANIEVILKDTHHWAVMGICHCHAWLM